MTIFDNGIILNVNWFDGPACTGMALGGANIGAGTIVQGSWERVSDVLLAPPGASSVRVWPVMVGSGTSDFTSFIDNIFVGDRLFSDGFES